MSNIRIDNIAPSAGGTYRNAPRGIAAAWVNFNGTGTPAIRDSENVGSITDNGVGDHTVNFTSNMANSNYAIPSSCTCEQAHARGTIGFGLAVEGDNTATSLTSSSCRMRALYGGSSTSNGGALDIRYSSAMYMGDLA